ncbi:MAG: C25 family cysteine peptidase, partial [bacterium]
VFVLSRDFPLIVPSRRQALYIAFTCDWAYFDDPTAQSFPEQLLAASERGAIGAIASTRLTYAFSNTQLARNYFANQFQEPRMTMGEALWLGKIQTRGTNSATYHLLGDPTLYLGFPRWRGEFISFNPYPLTPLSLSSVKGRALTPDGNPLSNFQGEAIFLLRDSAIPRRYTINTGGQPPEGIVLTYNLMGSIVFQGSFPVQQGLVEGQFIVSRDVTLGGGLGRATVYYYDQNEDGVFTRDSLEYSSVIASLNDTTPPHIEVFFDHRGYRKGEPIPPEPLLIVEVSDSNGINLTGSMGHGITVTIDDQSSVDLTTYFRYYTGSYQRGSAEYKLGPLEPGLHKIVIEAWDTPGNLGMETIDVEVVSGANGLIVNQVLNWPNPFREQTHLTFVITKPADYEVQVFTIAGTLLWSYRSRAAQPGMIFEPVWDGRDKYGRKVGNGVYIYKVIATDDAGNRAEGLGRIALIR